MGYSSLRRWSGFAARFVVPADAGVEGSYLVEVSGPSHAESGDIGIDGVEIVLRVAVAAVDDGAVASEVGVEEFTVNVIAVTVSGVDLAKACLGSDVWCAAVVAGHRFGDHTVEVALEVAGSDGAFIVEAAVEIAP